MNIIVRFIFTILLFVMSFSFIHSNDNDIKQVYNNFVSISCSKDYDLTVVPHRNTDFFATLRAKQTEFSQITHRNYDYNFNPLKSENFVNLSFLRFKFTDKFLEAYLADNSSILKNVIVVRAP